MSIIKNMGEAQEFFPAALTVDIKLISSVFPDVIDKYIIPFLSKTQFDLLETWYNNQKPEEIFTPEGGNPIIVMYLQNLLPYVQRVLVRFAIYMSVSQLDLKKIRGSLKIYHVLNLIIVRVWLKASWPG